MIHFGEGGDRSEEAACSVLRRVRGGRTLVGRRGRGRGEDGERVCRCKTAGRGDCKQKGTFPIGLQGNGK